MHPFEALFNEYAPLAKRLKFMRGIVQNPVPITREQQIEWEHVFTQLYVDIQSLQHRTIVALQENPNG